MTVLQVVANNKTPEYMRRHGLKLLANGYNIVPIQPNSKACLVSGWQSIKITEERVKQWVAENPNYGIGIRTDNLAVIDGDILHRDIARDLSLYIAMITQSEIKVTGLQPKFAFILRPLEDWETNDPIPVGKQVYDFCKPDAPDDAPDKAVKLEILYGPYQKVAYGIHPDTGRPYEWDTKSRKGPSKHSRGCPLSVKRDDLPVITNEQLKQIVAEYQRLCKAHGLVPASSSATKVSALSSDERDFMAIEQRLKLNDETEGAEVLADITSAVEYLRELTADPLGVNGGEGTYYNWLSVGQALASAKGTAIEDACLELWLSVSTDQDEADRKWQSFTADYTGYPALFAMAARYGWQNPRAKAEKQPETPRQRVMFFSLGSAKPKPVDWLITGLIETDGTGMVYGDSGVGKTFMTLDMALSVATGIPYHGKQVKQGAVFYIAGEGRNGITRRRAAWQHHRGVTPEQMENAPIYCSDGNLILNSASAKNIIQAVSDIAEAVAAEPRFVVLDTLARTMEGDENSAKDFNQYLQAATAIQDKFKCTVLIVHHTGKDGGRGARGSSAIKAGMDFSYALEKSGTAVILKCEKLKDGEPPQDLTYRLQPVSFDAEIEGGATEKLSSLVPVLLDGFDADEAKQVPLWPIEELVLHNKATNAKKLQQLLIDKYVSEHWEDDQPLAVPLVTLEREFKSLSDKTEKRDFLRAVETLEKAAVVSTGNNNSHLIIHKKHPNL